MGRGFQSRAVRQSKRALARGDIGEGPYRFKNDQREDKRSERGKRLTKKGGKNFSDLQFKKISLNGKIYLVDYMVLPDGEVKRTAPPVEHTTMNCSPLPVKCPETIRLLNMKLCIILNVENELKNRK